MKTLSKIVLALSIAASLAACGPDTPTPEQIKTQQNYLEENRAIAKTNSEYNAQLYRAANPRFTADFQIVSRSDTSQDKNCPSGDGWAELSIMRIDPENVKKVDKTVLMCSTYSASVGCFRKEDFDKDKILAGQDGPCNRDIPNPIPALKK